MPLSHETLAAAALIMTCTYMVFGLSGFGSTVLALPLLAQFMPIKFVVPMLLLLDFVAGMFLISRARRGVRGDELVLLLPFMVVGIGLGLTLFIRLPEPPLVAALGAFLLAYSVFGLSRRTAPLRLSKLWSAPLGLSAGALGALFGTGGVLTALYIGARLEDKHELRATAASAVLFNTATRLVLFAATGVLAQPGIVEAALWLLPGSMLGLFFGYRLHAFVPGRLVLRTVHLVLLVAGASLLVRVMALQ